MENSLHRQLKEAYADGTAQLEVALGDYRIDVVQPGRLVEIQHGSLAAIRDKLRQLLPDHRLLVVKPIVVERQIVKLDRRDGAPVSRRKSPKRGSILDLFDELIYLVRIFPHPHLQLDVPLVDIEELRYPGHGRRRRYRRTDFQVQDRRLIGIRQTFRFSTAADVIQVIPGGLPQPFHTGHLAEKLQAPRWVAQRIAYCLRHMAAIRQVGKSGNAALFEFPRTPRKAGNIGKMKTARQR